MDVVTVDLEFCYGIKKLHHAFDFSTCRAYAIYAPNGIMKSSFAQTFRDVADGRASSDRIFSERPTVRVIKKDSGTDLAAGDVMVIDPYDADLAPSERTSALLVDAPLRAEYEKLHVTIGSAREALLDAVKAKASSKKDFGSEISSAFTTRKDQLDTALGRVKRELEEQKDAPFADVEYDRIFDDRVITVLKTNDVRTAIEDYVRTYNELLSKSTFFKKGTFDYYNAGQIATSLANNGFFDASHTVRLNASGKSVEIATQGDLEAVIANEKDAIMKDKALRKRFDTLAKLFDKNTIVRDFRAYIAEHEPYLSQLSNIATFKENVLKSYLKACYPLYVDLITKLEAADVRKREIEAEAEKQRTQWEKVISIFNDRFVVPFRLETRNRTAVMLGQDPIIELGFTYLDGDEETPIEKDALLRSLSTGERKAYYILNVIFEVERRIKDGHETILIVDDIADSFDYQNKYAIIQYLKEISEGGRFKLVIMTHNFDFFRTIQSRFVGYKSCLMVCKSASGLALVEAAGIQNVFVKDWKKNFYTDAKKKIACVPFLRNLVEYTVGEEDWRFIKLTSILHWKANTAQITVGDVDCVYNSICKETGASADASKLVVDLIMEQAAACLASAAGVNFENKIVLATAIRLTAEKFMVQKINDDAFVASITKNQSYQLIRRFKEDFENEVEAQSVLDRVLLMTPENLHLNSFMYEPIVDMSDDALKQLYKRVIGLA